MATQVTVVYNEFISQVIVIHFIIFLVSCDSLSYCQVNERKMEDYFHRLKPNWVELESENNLFSEIK